MRTIVRRMCQAAAITALLVGLFLAGAWVMVILVTLLGEVGTLALCLFVSIFMLLMVYELYWRK